MISCGHNNLNIGQLDTMIRVQLWVWMSLSYGRGLELYNHQTRVFYDHDDDGIVEYHHHHHHHHHHHWLKG